MNVLEKILEEIIDELKEEGIITDNERGNRALEIIRSHMDDIPNANTSNKRLIDANALDEEVGKFFLAITGNPKQTTVVRECKESFRRMIEEQQTVYVNDDWIPCSKRLPEDGTYLCTLDGELVGEEGPFTGMCGLYPGQNMRRTQRRINYDRTK